MKKKYLLYLFSILSIFFISKTHCIEQNLTLGIKDTDGYSLPQVIVYDNADTQSVWTTLCSSNNCTYNNLWNAKYFRRAIIGKPSIEDYTILVNETKTYDINTNELTSKYVDMFILDDYIQYRSYDGTIRTKYIKNNSNKLVGVNINYWTDKIYNDYSIAITTISSNTYNNPLWNKILLKNGNLVNSDIKLYNDMNYEEEYHVSDSQKYYTFNVLWERIRFKFNFNTNEYEIYYNSLTDGIRNDTSRPYLNYNGNSTYNGNSNLDIYIGEIDNTTYGLNEHYISNLLFTTKDIEIYKSENTTLETIPQYNNYYQRNNFNIVYDHTITNNSYVSYPYNYSNSINLNQTNKIKFKFDLSNKQELINNYNNYNLKLRNIKTYFNNNEFVRPIMYIEKIFNDDSIKIEKMNIGETIFTINNNNLRLINVETAIKNFYDLEISFTELDDIKEINLVIDMGKLIQYKNNLNIEFSSNQNYNINNSLTNYQYLDLTNKYGVILNPKVKYLEQDIYSSIGLYYNENYLNSYNIKILDDNNNVYEDKYYNSYRTINFNYNYTNPTDLNNYITIVNNKFGEFINSNPITSGIWVDTYYFTYKVLDTPISDTTIENANTNQNVNIPNNEINNLQNNSGDLFEDFNFTGNNILFIFSDIWYNINNFMKDIILLFISGTLIVFIIKVIKK